MPSAFELRELDDVELEDRLGEYRKELLNLRFQLATGQLDNAARVGQVKRDVARVLTILRDREIALAEGREPTTGHAPEVRDEPATEPRRRARRPRKDADEEFETEDEARSGEIEDEADDGIDTEDAGADAGDDGEDA